MGWSQFLSERLLNSMPLHTIPYDAPTCNPFGGARDGDDLRGSAFGACIG